MIKLTEQESNHQDLDKMSIAELLQHMNEEDQTVPKAVQKSMPQIQRLVEVISDNMLAGGRLFYIGAGTSGRLGIVDASECPPTFGVPHGMVIGLIAGGDDAIRRAVEFAEDDRNQGWNDLLAYSITENDVVVGIAASGTTPYVIGALNKCRERGIATGCITCNIDSPVAASCEYPIEVPVGPEFVTGSTRLKSGTAQKLVLNMISTSVMIQLGRVEGNRMVNMQLSNEKLVDRGVKMLMDKTHQSYEDAKECLIREGSVKKAFDAWSLQNK